MGLDAVVYLRRENIPIDIEDGCLLIDKKTREVYIDDSRTEKVYPSEMFHAIDRRLGNIALIGYLQEKIPKLISDSSSLVVEKVLYRGYNTGEIVDIIEVKDLDALDSEIESIKQKLQENSDKSVATFLRSMKELVQAAKEQQNPIVFE